MNAMEEKFKKYIYLFQHQILQAFFHRLLVLLQMKTLPNIYDEYFFWENSQRILAAN